MIREKIVCVFRVIWIAEAGKNSQTIPDLGKPWLGMKD
jgi:hypothetical protein